MAITRSQQARQMYRSAGAVQAAYGAAAAKPGPVERPSGGDNRGDRGGGNNLQKVADVVGTGSDIYRVGSAIKQGSFKPLMPTDPISAAIMIGLMLKNRGQKKDDQVSLMNNLDDNPMLVADALTTPTEGKFGVSLNDYSKLKNAGYNDNQIQELQLNPKIDVKEVIRDIEGPIFAAADGGRIGAMGGGIMGGLADGQMDEMGRQMYGLGKLVKKVTRTVKKIAKSPIGKAALLYVGAGGLGNLAAGKSFFAGKGIGGLFKPTQFLSNVPKIFSGSGLQNIGSKIGLGGFENVGGNRIFQKNLLGKILTSPTGVITATSLLPLLGIGTGDETEEEAKQLIADNTGLNFDELRPQGAMRFAADGGLMRLGYQEGGDAEPVAKKTMPLIDMGGKEKDYRETGGFVDMGRMERADDVPARLSKNEFVFTADAVRNAGDGNIDKGAEVMYNMMKNLEAGGEVSEESQGLEGARRMFQTSQRLEEVI